MLETVRRALGQHDSCEIVGTVTASNGAARLYQRMYGVHIVLGCPGMRRIEVDLPLPWIDHDWGICLWVGAKDRDASRVPLAAQRSPRPGNALGAVYESPEAAKSGRKILTTHVGRLVVARG